MFKWFELYSRWVPLNCGLQKYEAGNINLKDELFQKHKVGFSNQQLLQKHIFLVPKTDFVVSKE